LFELFFFFPNKTTQNKEACDRPRRPTKTTDQDEDSFKTTYQGQTIKIPTTVRAVWLANRFGIPEGSVIGVQLPDGLEIDLTIDINTNERRLLRGQETIIIVKRTATTTTTTTTTTTSETIDWGRSVKLQLAGGQVVRQEPIPTPHRMELF